MRAARPEQQQLASTCTEQAEQGEGLEGLTRTLPGLTLTFLRLHTLLKASHVVVWLVLRPHIRYLRALVNWASLASLISHLSRGAGRRRAAGVSKLSRPRRSAEPEWQ